MKLYKFQQECVDDIFKQFKTTNKVCLAWYTGAGKTNVFCEVIRRTLEQNPRAQVGVSAYITTEIKAQIVERLESFGLGEQTHMVSYPERIDENKNIHVFNPQGLFNETGELRFDLLVIDEGHIAMADHNVMLNKILKKTTTEKTKILLVSATPWDTLATKRFKDVAVLKRPMDMGIKDGLITDFQFHAEEAQIEFTEQDFSRSGDLKAGALKFKHEIIMSACVGKMRNILEKYDKQLGDKVLVICPPGNFGECTDILVKEFGGLAFKQFGRRDGEEDTTLNLELFKEDAESRFLYVINKCQVGFDYQELNSVIDLTMTRNISVLCQRMGRIARKNGKAQKHYFYVYDKSVVAEKLDWLIITLVDFCMGHYDGWTTRTTKWRDMRVAEWRPHVNLSSTSLSQVIKVLSEPASIRNVVTLRYTSTTRPTKRTLDEAIAEAKTFKDRTDMWRRKPALYKWFRLNAIDELHRLFPLKNHIGKWNEDTVIAAMKASSSRIDFRRRFSGALYWVETRKRQDMFDTYLPDSRSTKKWNEKSVLALLKRLRTWAHLRTYAGARRWISSNGSEKKWKEVWIGLHGRSISADQLRPLDDYAKRKEYRTKKKDSDYDGRKARTA